MDKRTIIIGFLLTILMSIHFPAYGQQPITTGSLFVEMIDLSRLATFPDPSYRMIQFSSYDRRSNLPGGPDWFANSDGFGGEPIPNFEKVLQAPDKSGIGEYLMADVRGPGAIVRLWTARISGSIRVLLDESDKPIDEGNADDFFRRPYEMYSQMKSVDGTRFQKTIYQRDASYAPIPFSDRLQIIWRGNIEDIHFYQIQVRLYPLGTRITAFSPADIEKYRKVIDRVTHVLEDPDTRLAARSEDTPKDFSAQLAPSEKTAVFEFAGSAALERFTLRIDADDMEKALRQTLLHIACDDYPWGQVQSPVGDFFGAAPDVNPYQSLPFTVREDGSMTCRWVMPFEKSIRIIVENRGDQPVRINGDALVMPFDWNDRSMHFRARWRVDHELIASNKDVQDLPFLLADGKGVYVGTTSYLLNPCEVPTPGGNWWGEGDEKVFVDDDLVPSIFGTGSEDYYNYSWSSPDIFDYPYCGQPRNDGPGNRGFVTNYRWHILDPIPFNQDIRFFMELFSHEKTPGLSYARIGYHYARPGGTDDHQPLMPEDIRNLTLPDSWQPAARGAARNSVFFESEDIVPEGGDTGLVQGRLWSDGQILVWKPKKTGDQISFQIPNNTAENKRFTITAGLTPRSGRISVLLNGRKQVLSDDSREIDLYRPYRTLLRNYYLKPSKLKSGNQTLTLEYLGAPQSVNIPEIGIDFIWLKDMEN